MKKRKATDKQKAFKKLNKDYKNLVKDLNAIVAESKFYTVSNDWIGSLPISSLHESLDKDHLRPRTRMAYCDFKLKEKLSKDYNKKIDSFDILRHKTKEAEIDCILEKIAEALDEGTPIK